MDNMTWIRRLSTLPCIVLLGIIVSGCGSRSQAQTEQGAIDNLKTVLATYDSDQPHNVTSTGTACATALNGLRDSVPLSDTPSPGKDQRIRTDLRYAYLSARAGFADCARGAQKQDYLEMARGDAELATANAHIADARTPVP